MMNCPLCKIKLNQAILANVEVDYCPQCLGLWFEQDELRMAKDEKDKELNWLDIDLWQDKGKFRIGRQLKPCPACRLPLYQVGYDKSKIEVDVCNVCFGVWLDRGEFRAIIDYLKKQAPIEILNNYVKNLLREAGEIFTGPETLREEVADFLTVLKLLKYKFASQHPEITKIISALPK